MRSLLLNKSGVLSLDFQNQENRRDENHWDLHPELMWFKRNLRGATETETLLFKRWMELPNDLRSFNRIVQGNCAELILVALDYLFNKRQTEVKVLPHFHDELVLECLVCSEHQGRKPWTPLLRLKKR